MNYIKIINWFWDEVPHTNGYRPLYGLLFFALIDGINKNGWRPNTIMDYERIVNKCKFTKEVYLNGRKWLMENNFIEFKPGKNNMQMASFSLGSAVGKLTGIPTGIPTGELTSTTTYEQEENLPASLPVSLPNTKHKTNKHLKDKLKTIDLNISFKNFYDLYDKKVGAKKSESLWIKLTDEERSLAIEHIPKYKISKPEKQFRKDPVTYLNNKSFNDEIIIQNGNTNGNFSAKAVNNREDGLNLLGNSCYKELAELERQ